MFYNRDDAAEQLAEKLHGRKLYHPLVLAIPRGGLVTGAVLARHLGAELDVVLSRKLRAPDQPELAIGAIAEDGRVYFNHKVWETPHVTGGYLAAERRHQLTEIRRRRHLFRAVRPQARIMDRSVIVTDDGIATGSTMIAALKVIKTQRPRELIVAVPVASPDRLAEVSGWCDEIVCLVSRAKFEAIGHFYADFRQVDDDEAIELFRYASSRPRRVVERCRPLTASTTISRGV
jgi:predicted phosphoribosyltransferase